ncbi:hypothetical protein HUG17_5551 [Dermatophagoides farinae]|uniref:Mannosyltransferase n=1 Tax=Dermatophagoides farinae TaxID=6954 RepID=A0A9D4P0H6_DERFA|nr:hypothetical protein HUG17_5551 [Dermatophagoides farinae]
MPTKRRLGKQRKPSLPPRVKNEQQDQDYTKQSETNTHSYISTKWIFVWFLFARLCSALWNNINDCDETFNYWEPSHFLIYGNGFQTWEYSPKYAIRSYAYLWLYMLPAKLLKFFFSKIVIFYITRFYMVMISASIETFLFISIRKYFGNQTAVYYCATSCLAAGMFNSMTTFLPSSFAIYIVCLSLAFWLRDNDQLFIFFFAFGSILGWPFISVIGIPMALFILLSSPKQFIKASCISALIILIPTIAIDSYYYGKFVFASLNIILYNVFSEHGPNIYGTEPFSYYIRNLFLNFNIFFFISLSSFPILNWIMQFLLNCSLHLWYMIFFYQAHKEERFMYPIYPLLCLTTSLTFNNLTLIVACFSPSARISALFEGYYSSMNIYHKFWEPNMIIDSTLYNTTTTTTRIICLGKEWHRFPSNFFIPSKFRIEFIASEFRGQLPKHFDTNVTYPTHYPDYYGRDYPYSKHPESWIIIKSLPFLDQKRSPNILRTFSIPFIFESKCQFIDYNLLANIRYYNKHH